MSKMLEKAVEGKPGSVDVDFFQFAIEIGVFIDKTDLQPVGVFKKFPDFYRFQAAGLLIIRPPPCA
jgi:hypothetical protein